MLAVLADSPSLARRDLEQARAFAHSIGMPLHIVNTDELERPSIARNDANRCFHCKDELFAVHASLGATLGYTAIAYGMNVDDTRDFAPASAQPKSTPFLPPLPTPASPSSRSARSPKPPAIRSGIAPPRPACPRALSTAAPSPAKFSAG
jgi:hypothetical protein